MLEGRRGRGTAHHQVLVVVVQVRRLEEVVQVFRVQLFRDPRFRFEVLLPVGRSGGRRVQGIVGLRVVDFLGRLRAEGVEPLEYFGRRVVLK